MIETASFNIDSPNINENKDGLTPTSLKIDNTATGSVADIKAPNAKQANKFNSSTFIMEDTPNIRQAVISAAIIVPNIAYIMILPKFL